MILLAIEFSSAVRSVAVLRAESQASSAEPLGSLSDGGSRSVPGLSLVEQLFTQLKLRPRDIEEIVVGLGPGSYTGIRSSVALAQGWQLARAVRLSGISTVECLAFQAQQLGWYGDCRIAIDAQRQEVYSATYRISKDQRELVEPLRLVSVSELAEATMFPEATLMGPEINRWAATGKILIPDASAAGQLVQLGTYRTEMAKLDPIYLRVTNFVKTADSRGTLGIDSGGPRL